MGVCGLRGGGVAGRRIEVEMTVVGTAIAATAAKTTATAAAWPDKHLFNMTIKTSQTAHAHACTRPHTLILVNAAIWHRTCNMPHTHTHQGTGPHTNK